MDFRSIHTSKGLGADVVVICDMLGGTYGFPDRRAEDPMIAALLDKKTKFPDEGERRLFYVALTRAKQFVLLCTDWGNTSSFISEIEAYPEILRLPDEGRPAPAFRCAACSTGRLQKGAGFSRWACKHWKHCGKKYDSCDHCGAPLLPLDGGVSCGGCGYRPPRCRGCGIGYQLVRKGGQYGCTRYRSDPQIVDRCSHRATQQEVAEIRALAANDR